MLISLTYLVRKYEVPRKVDAQDSSDALKPLDFRFKESREWDVELQRALSQKEEVPGSAW